MTLWPTDKFKSHCDICPGIKDVHFQSNAHKMSQWTKCSVGCYMGGRSVKAPFHSIPLQYHRKVLIFFGWQHYLFPISTTTLHFILLSLWPTRICVFTLWPTKILVYIPWFQLVALPIFNGGENKSSLLDNGQCCTLSILIVMGEIRQCLHENLAALLTIRFHLEKLLLCTIWGRKDKSENCQCKKKRIVKHPEWIVYELG